jgi:hypothetical protein
LLAFASNSQPEATLQRNSRISLKTEALVMLLFFRIDADVFLFPDHCRDTNIVNVAADMWQNLADFPYFKTVPLTSLYNPLIVVAQVRVTICQHLSA